MLRQYNHGVHENSHIHHYVSLGPWILVEIWPSWNPSSAPVLGCWTYFCLYVLKEPNLKTINRLLLVTVFVENWLSNVLDRPAGFARLACSTFLHHVILMFSANFFNLSKRCGRVLAWVYNFICLQCRWHAGSDGRSELSFGAPACHSLFKHVLFASWRSSPLFCISDAICILI
jgi:hypothetical protein